MEQYIDKDVLVAEIEKRIKNLYPKGGQGMVVTKILKDHYEDLLSFIDTLPSEEEPALTGEEQTEIDFEQELYKAFGQVKDFTLGMRIAKWFYDMGKNSQEPVSEDFEEAGKEWLRPQLDKTYAKYGETKMMELTRFDGYAMLDAIEFGAQWQKKKVKGKG